MNSDAPPTGHPPAAAIPPAPARHVEANAHDVAGNVRKALQLLSRHGCDFSVESYGLWLAYVEGQHPELTSTLDPVVREGHRVTAHQTQRLYRAAVLHPQEDAIARLKDAFGDLVGKAAASTASASSTTHDFLARVRGESELLSQDAPEHPALGRLLEHATLFAHTIGMLSDQLNESRREIHSLNQQLESMRRDAFTDPLTGVSNRRAFDEELEALCQSTDGSPFCLVLVDLDDFKDINDGLGHVFGDRVLRTIAQLLRHQLKGRDMVARYGGDEFAILLPSTPLAAAGSVAEQIRAVVAAARIRQGGKEVRGRSVTLSCGVADRRKGDHPMGLIERADSALYRAKTRGRNRVVVCGEE